MAARKDASAEDQASEDSEEGEEEDVGFSEYDSTWEEEDEDDDGDEEKEDRAQLEEKPGKKGREAAAAGAKEKSKPQEKPGRGSPSATWASGIQERRKANHSSMGFRRCKVGAKNGRGGVPFVEVGFVFCQCCSVETGTKHCSAAPTQVFRRHRTLPSLPPLGDCSLAGSSTLPCSASSNSLLQGLEEAEVEEQEMWNLSFYKNEIHFKPHGLHIEDLLEKWQNDYATLEENHSYIQWLFPLREPGMNWRAKILTCQEIEAFKKSKEVMERFVRAYKLMLGFYGINLINEETGELKRAENWCERFENLNRYSHNNLRITRILKCLGEMGYEHYQVHLVKFFLAETLIHQQLPRVLRSALDYFMFTVRNKQRRQELVYFAWQNFRPKREFVWGPHKKLRRFKPRSPEFLSHQEPRKEKETMGGGASQGMEKGNAEPPNEISQGLKEEPSRDGADEAVKKDLPEPLNEHTTDRTTRNSPTGQPGSQTSNELSFPSSDSMINQSGGKDPTSAVEGDGSQGGDAVESQARRTVEHTTTSEEDSVSTRASPAEVKEEKRGDKEDPPVPPPREESGSGAEGESLKEAKKRKLDMSRLMGEKSESSLKGPTDIEKISFNLEEVVIDPKDAGKRPPVEEQVKLLASEEGTGDGSDVKEAESVSAVIKRRKVEETAPKEGVSKTPGRVDTEGIPLEGQVTNCSTSRLERTEKVCQDGIRIVTDHCADALTSCRTGSVDLLANSQALSSKPGLSLGDSRPDKTDEPETTSVIENKESPPPETQPASKREVDKHSGQEEGGIERKKEAATERNTSSKVEKSEMTTGGSKEEE
nr:opioid growth factor receptor [Pogona vitticeps]